MGNFISRDLTKIQYINPNCLKPGEYYHFQDSFKVLKVYYGFNTTIIFWLNTRTFNTYERTYSSHQFIEAIPLTEFLDIKLEWS